MADEKKQMTEEEIKKLIEEKNKQWEAYIKKLKDNPKGTTVNEDLLMAVEAISEDMQGMAQMVQMLHHNLGQVIRALQAGSAGMPGKTKGGIILP